VKKPVVFLTVLLLMVLQTGTSAQNPADVFNKLGARKPGQGVVAIHQDANIRDLVFLHLTQQKKLNGIMGYKISIYRGSGQNAQKEAEAVSANILSKYEGLKIERIFEFPQWKVYVGAFRTKSEALMFLDKISKDYPNDAFIRPALIPFPD
jgi:hypothetical protein